MHLELQNLQYLSTQLRDEVAQQTRLAEDLHLAQMHHDAAAELQSKRLGERLERLEERDKAQKVLRNRSDTLAELSGVELFSSSVVLHFCFSRLGACSATLWHLPRRCCVNNSLGVSMIC